MRRLIPKKSPESGYRVLVTGSRGKSTIVRLLHTAFVDAGLQSHARITGVLPRQLTATGERVISRSSGAHVEEMRWWLRQLPASAGAVVLENSAITPEFQGLAARWLQPDITVLSNTVPDHQEAWGPDRRSAARVLVSGVPRGGRLVLPVSLESDGFLLDLLAQRDCQPLFADPVAVAGPSFHAVNLGLALEAVCLLGMEREKALKAMAELPPDGFDFKVIDVQGTELAMAFSANDLHSTHRLFESLSWDRGETRLVYNHRRDRPERLKSFAGWLRQPGWRDVIIIGDRPPRKMFAGCYRRVRNKTGLLKLLKPGERVFGCGNISGVPFSLAFEYQRGEGAPAID